MTDKEISNRLVAIRETAPHDPEGAHILEDSLVWDFIESIACLSGEIGRRAKLLMKSKDIDFPRWCG